MTIHKGWFDVDIEKRAARVRSLPIPNIIKEALSNSLDAGATTIAMSCKRADGKRRDGDGLRAFEVTCTDNGAGCDDPEILRRVGSTTNDLHAERRGRFGQGLIDIIAAGEFAEMGRRDPVAVTLVPRDSEGRGEMSKRNKMKVSEARRAKTKRPQRTHQSKVVKNRLGMRVRPAHCTACTAFDEHAAETGWKTVDTCGKVAAEILCTFFVKQPIPWFGSPAMPYACEWEHDAHGNHRAFHGTAYCFVQDILRHGLQPKRESGMVYFSPYVARAETYAKSWAVGMQACGVTDELRASVLWFSLPEDEAYSQEDACDFSVARSVEHSELSEEMLIDFSDLSPETSDYIGYLQSFATIVGFHRDPYREENWYLEMHKRAQMRFNELRESVSPVVFFRSRYVPKA